MVLWPCSFLWSGQLSPVVELKALCAWCHFGPIVFVLSVFSYFQHSRSLPLIPWEGSPHLSLLHIVSMCGPMVLGSGHVCEMEALPIVSDQEHSLSISYLSVVVPFSGKWVQLGSDITVSDPHSLPLMTGAGCREGA